MPAEEFRDKVALITGGASGIGLGCVEVFLAAGCRIALVDRDADALQQACGRLGGATSERVRGWEADVADSGRLQQCIHEAAEAWGRLDFLINNAGIHPPDTPLEANSDEELQRVMEVNFGGTYVACRTALQYLRKTRGAIVNMSSMTAVLGQRNSTAYCASKGAQLSFTKSMALEAADAGVRVNAVLPGNVDTPLMRSWAATLPDPEAALQRIAALQPLGRMATSEEIGRVCLFLCSEAASFITGQGLHVDGGASLDY